MDEKMLEVLINQMEQKIVDKANGDFPLADIMREYRLQEEDLKFMVVIGELEEDEADSIGFRLYDAAINAMKQIYKATYQ